MGKKKKKTRKLKHECQNRMWAGFSWDGHLQLLHKHSSCIYSIETGCTSTTSVVQMSDWWCHPHTKRIWKVYYYHNETVWLEQDSLLELVWKWVQLCKFERPVALPFFVIGMKTDLFQSCGHCWVFQICWHIECGTFTASSLRIWNSSTGIPSPPLALFLVILPKAHLTWHSRVSGFRLVITHHCVIWVIKIFFCIVLLGILATSC